MSWSVQLTTDTSSLDRDWPLATGETLGLAETAGGFELEEFADVLTVAHITLAADGD